ncbi:MAG: hypothetical protein R2690_09705 [Acidimicrobiales bacterium]
MFAHTVPPTHSSSFSRGTAAPAAVTPTVSSTEKSSRSRIVNAAEPSDITNRSPSSHSPHPSPV